MCHIYSSLSKIDVNELFVSKDDFPNVQFKFLKLMLHVQTTWEESAAGRLQLVGGQERRQEQPAGFQLLGWEEVWQGAAPAGIQF